MQAKILVQAHGTPSVIRFWYAPPCFQRRGEGRNRTDAYSFCRAVPNHLATPPCAIADGHATRSRAALPRKSSAGGGAA